MGKRSFRWLSLIALVILTLTGCNSSLSWEHLDECFINTKQIVSQVGQRNIDVIREYGRAGLLTEYEVNSLSKSIEDQTTAMISGEPITFINRLDGAAVGVIAPGSSTRVEQSTLTGSRQNINGCISARFPDESETLEDGTVIKGWEITSCSWNNDIAGKLAEAIKSQASEDNTKAMQFLDESFKSQWAGNVNKTIYILKDNLNASQFNDAVNAALEASNNPTDPTKFATLTQYYFTNSGTRLEVNNTADMLAISETSNAQLGDVFDLTDDGESSLFGKLNTVNNHLSLCASATVKKTIEYPDGTKEAIEKDLRVVVAQIKVQELSMDFLSKIDFSKVTDNKYVIPQISPETVGQSSDPWMNAAFLMEYPVQVLSQIQLGKDKRDAEVGGNDYKFVFQDSPMTINLINGEMLYNGVAVNKDSEELDKIYRLVGDSSSFTVLPDSSTNASAFFTEADQDIQLVSMLTSHGELDESEFVGSKVGANDYHLVTGETFFTASKDYIQIRKNTSDKLWAAQPIFTVDTVSESGDTNEFNIPDGWMLISGKTNASKSTSSANKLKPEYVRRAVAIPSTVKASIYDADWKASEVKEYLAHPYWVMVKNGEMEEPDLASKIDITSSQEVQEYLDGIPTWEIYLSDKDTYTSNDITEEQVLEADYLRCDIGLTNTDIVFLDIPKFSSIVDNTDDYTKYAEFLKTKEVYNSMRYLLSQRSSSTNTEHKIFMQGSSTVLDTTILDGATIYATYGTLYNYDVSAQPGGEHVGKTIKADEINVSDVRQQGDSWVYEYNGYEYYCTAPIKVVPKTCTVILTDYLELTYMPDVIDEEPYVATGRRVRLTGPFEGTFSDGMNSNVAVFTDRKGDLKATNDTLTTVNISNIIDYCTGTGYYTDVASKLGVNGATNSKEVEEEIRKPLSARAKYLAEAFGSTIDTTNNSSIAADGMLGDFSLKHTAYYTWIRPVLKFGSTGDSDTPALAKNDADKELPVALYGLCVDTNMFDTGLYTNWITVTGDGGENGSVSWWNSWLKSHNFTYQVPMSELLSMIEDMYSVSIADKEDIIVLNLETINDINKLSEKKEEERLERTETTSFRVFGYILFLYGFLLPIAWVFDINMSNGPQFLSIITFGKYIALIDDGGMPMYNDTGKTYATLKTVIITTLSVWVVGAILILVPISRIFEWVTGFIKTLWDVFQKAIRGMR